MSKADQSDLENQLRAIIDTVVDGIITIDAEGVIASFNPAAERIFGYSAHEVIGKNVSVLTPEPQRSQHDRYLQSYLTTGKRRIIGIGRQVEGVRKDGSRFPLELAVSEMAVAGGRMFTGVIRDLSARVEAEQEVARVRARLETATDAAKIGIWEWDVFANTLTWDQQMYRLYGVSPQQFGGAYEAWQAGVHPKDRERCDAEVQQALKGERPFETAFRVVWPDGAVRYLQAAANVVRDSEGKPLRMIGANWDITQRKADEEQIQAASTRYDALVRQSGAFAWEVNPDGVYTYVSPNTAELIGYPPEELVGRRHFWDISPAEDQLALRDAGLGLIREGRPIERIENRIQTPDGRILWVSTSGTPVHDDAGRVMGYRGIDYDVTARREAEEKATQLARGNERRRALLEDVRVGYESFLTGPDTCKAFDIFLRGLLQITESEYGFIGEVLTDEAGAPYLKTHALTNIAWNEETRRFYDQHAPTGLEFRNLKTLFGHVMTTREPVIANNPATDPRRGGLPPGHPRMDAFLGIPIKEGNEVIAMVGVANRPGGYDSDLITELEPLMLTIGALIANMRLRSAASHRERLATIGQTVAGISHSIKNNLLLSEGGASLLSHAIDQGDMQAARESWAIVKRGIDKIGGLARDMLDYSSNKQPDLHPANINDMVCAIAEEVEPQLIKKNVKLEFDADESIGEHVVDDLGLQRTISNLIVNAMEAIQHNQGQITIATSQRPDGTLVITIRDNGGGISADMLEKIWHPFFTTKASTGTGLGLPMCKKCIEDMNGRIYCKSEENLGTLFTIEIPKMAPA
jgi:PAS domain S-box-containing protein